MRFFRSWCLALCLAACATAGSDPGQPDAADHSAPDARAGCVPSCAGYSCGQTEPCGTTCGSACDTGCIAHCQNDVQDCGETAVDCGGGTCAACGCTPSCAGYSCGQTEPCGTTCGSACDPGCGAHCSNGVQDCDETGVNCGGSTCGPCACVPTCAGYSCGQLEPSCGTACGSLCDPGCSGHCGNGVVDCDETGVDCGGANCVACGGGGCGSPCYYYGGSCSILYIGACDGCDMGCEFHDPDCDGSACMSACPCLLGFSTWYCDGFDDCVDPSCECPGE